MSGRSRDFLVVGDRLPEAAQVLAARRAAADVREFGVFGEVAPRVVGVVGLEQGRRRNRCHAAALSAAVRGSAERREIGRDAEDYFPHAPAGRECAFLYVRLPAPREEPRMTTMTKPAERATAPRAYSPEEWALRVELAACYRIFDYLGWTEMIFNHITMRVPGPEHHFLINPFGLHYSEVTASNLVKIDLDGKIVGHSDYPGQPGRLRDPQRDPRRGPGGAVHHPHAHDGRHGGRLVEARAGAENFYAAQSYRRRRLPRFRRPVGARRREGAAGGRPRRQAR